MTREDKQLLVKDLCQRLPYGVRCAGWLNITSDKDVDKVYPWVDGELMDGITDIQVRIQGTWIKIEFVRPYLRPLSSMTPEEKKYIKYKWGYSDWDTLNDFMNYSLIDTCDAESFIDWLNANHFDYRGLIEKGLAIDATGLNIY